MYTYIHIFFIYVFIPILRTNRDSTSIAGEQF